MMYKFYPIIIIEDGEILHNPFALSHAELIDCCIDLRNKKHKNHILATYKPKENRFDDINNYNQIIKKNANPD